MKKRIMSLLAVAMFMGGNLNVNAMMFRDCGQLSMDIYNAWLAQGFTYEFANSMADSAYELCTVLPHEDQALDEILIIN